MMISGDFRNLHLIPGVSGSGKTTLARNIEQTTDGASIVVGYSTREMRTGEVDGVDYKFSTTDHLNQMLREQDNTVWRYSEVGGNYYYCSDRETLPSPENPVRVLPVSYSTLSEVMHDYLPLLGDGIMTIVPIIIDKDIQEEWIQKIQPLRPNRNLEKELKEQDTVLSTFDFDSTYTPTWHLEDDCKKYLDLYKAIIHQKTGIHL